MSVKQIKGRPAGIVYFYLRGAGRSLWSWGTGLESSTGDRESPPAPAKQLCDYAFCTLDINRICASALEANTGSWRVMEKLGMRREGRFVKAIYQDGAFFDDLYYAVLREEYRLT